MNNLTSMSFFVKLAGYHYAYDVITCVLDDALLEKKDHRYVKNRLLDIMKDKDESFDRSIKSSKDFAGFLKLSLGISEDEKRQLFTSGFGAGMEDYLKSLVPYLSKKSDLG